MTPEEETFNRLKSPAPKIDAHGNKFWFKNGKFHRDNDLPAVIFNDGELHWFKNGKRHREYDLPAVIHANGKEEYFKNGIQII